MIYYPCYVRDTIGNNYIGINIPNDIVNPYLEKLKEILEDDYDEYVSFQQKRDHGNYHITVINTMDYNKLSKEHGMSNFVNSLDKIFNYEIDDLKLMGIGNAKKNENEAYFIVCNSEKLDSIRNRYNLPKQDFHITLGFKWKDVFGVRKNEILPEVNKFLKLLSKEYYKYENWNFIKNIENYNMNIDSEIIPVKLTDSLLKVKCDNYFMDIGQRGNKFWIYTKYSVDKDMPKLSEHELSKIFNKK